MGPVIGLLGVHRIVELSMVRSGASFLAIGIGASLLLFRLVLGIAGCFWAGYRRLPGIPDRPLPGLKAAHGFDPIVGHCRGGDAFSSGCRPDTTVVP